MQVSADKGTGIHSVVSRGRDFVGEQKHTGGFILSSRDVTRTYGGRPVEISIAQGSAVSME